MVRLQEVKRPNGSTLSVLTIPKEAKEMAGLQKGDELYVAAEGKGKLSVRRME